VIEEEHLVVSEDLKVLGVSDIMCSKYTRLVSCHAESTFSYQITPL
jgi:hypothetical protein